MKHHLNIIIIALRVVLFVAAIMCVFNLIQAYGFIQTDDPVAINEFFLNYFTAPKLSLGSLEQLGARYFFNIKWLAIGFTITYTALLVYGITGIIRLYKCLLKIEKGQMFYNEQGAQFRKVGATVIIFAKLKYVLFCFTGILSYLDISTFFKQLPAFLTLYLVGKLIFIMSYITEKGEFIQEENELTI
ncbi:hypothetical protein [Flavobacterium cerinum]|uniref:DUF2975 domain-containing protein n=1 Tax=Flavobacterium cerinum TaxID=2502784 RepID=A0A3S3SEI1_9FLAO|nr:hypothetical protein [Flavobacterium cerinum]RWX00220.1 hypothetical protein EPI11_10075 [Flavobacterium cerinum]